jgi:4-amino-4-deoxy-L-arabinose transferase-like glycosyltransferase
MLTWFRHVASAFFADPSALAVLASLAAVLAGARMARRISRQEADLTHATQPLTTLARGSFETLALTSLLLLSLITLGLYCLSVIYEVGHVSPAVI